MPRSPRTATPASRSPRPSDAPEGLGFTGNPEFAVPASLLGVPALSLPLFEVNAMPLGLQVIGFFDRDADAFAIAAWSIPG